MALTVLFLSCLLCLSSTGNEGSFLLLSSHNTSISSSGSKADKMLFHHGWFYLGPSRVWLDTQPHGDLGGPEGGATVPRHP